jgi:hypothetical protein
MDRKKKVEKNSFGKKVGLAILKSPYYAVRGIYRLNKKAEAKSEERKVTKKREAMTSVYLPHQEIKVYQGDFEKWEENFLKSDSKIGIILGARGSGKSAFGIKFLENVHAKTQRNCYAMGFQKNEMPSWINVVEKVEEIKNLCCSYRRRRNFIFFSELDVCAEQNFV